MAVAHSQLDPLPQNLPFEIISKTIGRGAYASVKKGRVEATGDVFAVKFIHRRFALERGCMSLRQIQSEVALHKHCGMHKNLIQYYDSGEDDVWTWIAMEYASGGDLFDKIEADVGVEEDISHFYFTQLVAGVSYIHGQGVAHRDIKPENILLDGGGNLKIADFGLAALFRYQDRYKYSKTLCGSPPYVAPEVLQGQYRGDLVDIWSCGVLLFTLLSGNTPWDEPTDMSMEFHEYRAQKGRPTHEPWLSLPSGSLSLIRGMMKIDPEDRFKFEDIRRHPWFTRPNPYLTHDGLCHNGVNLATKLMKGLHIDFTKRPFPKKAGETLSKLSSSTQPEAPVDRQVEFEWERLYQPTSQPLKPPENFNSQDLWASLAEDPSMSQFAPPHRGIPQSLTQKARNFNDICPSQRMTRFYSPYSFRQLLPIIASALHRLGVSIPSFKETQYEEDNVETWIPVKTEDSRRCLLRGDIIVERLEGDVLVVTFAKTQGDPLEWRRFFKKVAVLSKEAVWMGPDCD